MIRRLFAVWPPGWAMATAGIIYLFFQGIFLTTEFIERGQFFFRGGEAAEILMVISYGFVTLYAMYRVVAFHPAFRVGYYEWLRSTPWTSAKPLPMGPVHLVWQDVVLLAAVFGLNFPRADLHSIVVIQVFVVIYLMMLGIAHYWTQQKIWAYAVFFAGGFLIVYGKDTYEFWITAAVIYAIAYAGLRAALAAWPWEDVKDLRKTMSNLANANSVQHADTRNLGWPYDRLGPPRVEEVDTPWDFTYVTGVLIAWWMYVGYRYLAPNMPDRGLLPMYGYMVAGIIGRVAGYCVGYAPPISLLGRLLTGRWIIPGYDQVFIAPLAALGVGIGVWYVATNLRIDPNGRIDPIFVTPIGFALIWWVLMAMPPSLRQWRLTGNHRIVPGVMANVQKTQ